MWCLKPLLVAALLVTPVGASAQQSDRDYLTAFLEDNLSDAGREVTITGFAGALSSRATVQQLTIADADGIWITLNGVTLDWSRSALLSGEVEINALTADEILIDRLPKADGSTLPDPEAKGFSLPVLPVSVQIGQLAATRIVLGSAVLGQAIEGSLAAALSLADGEGQARLDLTRTDDGPSGRITLDASYANASRQLVMDLSATEDAGGIVSGLLNLPGDPSVALKITGTGPIDDFTSDIALETDGMPRVSGTVALRGDDQGGIGFNVDISGDVVPLLAPDYAPFFGEAASLRAAGTRDALGGIRLDVLAVATDGLRMDGQVSLAPDGQPLRFDLKGDLGLPDGTPVVLPFGRADKTEVTSANIALQFDAAKGEGWTLDAHLRGLRRPDIAIDALALVGSGRIGRTSAGSNFSAALRFSATGALPTDPGLAQALGTDLSGEVVAHFQDGVNGLNLPRLTIDGQGYSARASGRINGLETGLKVEGTASAVLEDLSRLSTLAGRPLKGSATINLAGSGSPLGGSFDVTGGVDSPGLGLGRAEVDRLLADGAKIAVSVVRDQTGISLRRLDVVASTLTASASGTLASRGSDVRAKLAFTDISTLGPKYGGALTVDAALTGTPQDGRIVVSGQGQGLRVGQTETDTLLRGTSTLSATLAIKDGVVTLQAAQLANPQVTGRATGRMDGALRDIALEARLANLALILPEFPGAVTLAGTATDTGSAYRIDLRGNGPAQIDARVTGTLAKSGGTADLAISGTAQSALANVFIEPRSISGPARFDLTLKGPLALRSLAGGISVQGARFSDVEFGIGIADLAAKAVLAGGRATVEAGGTLRTGGQVAAQGTIGLAAPYDADISINLIRATLRNPDLFEAETNGTLRLAGPLLGGARVTGRIDIATAELRIPSGGLSGLGAIPDIRHIDDRAAVRETRRKAGLFGASGGGAATGGRAGGPVYGLDIDLTAPSRLFLRGRGLDAELSGRLSLGGTSANIIPSGQFSLIRGRLDILGKRLTLSEASLQLQGDFVPYVAIAASNVSNGVTSTVRIDGPAEDPQVTFTSDPDLPQEEVLAQLLFGRGLESLSAFQAAQLANAVASLAGKGGEGIVGRLRKNFGLDDFDVTSDDTGSTVVRAGKYINENVYTEVEVGEDGTSEINLNLDLRPGLTVTGRVGQDGETGLGIFLERDY
jgi:translocation and assembly module TamB